MDLRILRRPVCELLQSRSQCLLAANIPARRHESTYRRTKKALNVAPDASFLPTGNTQQDHVIFNPPSAAPSVLHTPLKFLPKDDKRRQLFAKAQNSTIAPYSSKLPPPVLKQQKGYERYHLTEEDVAEIRRLRQTDPNTWSRLKLARKFNCTSAFVAMCCEAPKEKADAEAAKLAAIKARWGPKRTRAREDREKRLEAVYRDE
jgi:hypothetical protein